MLRELEWRLHGARVAVGALAIALVAGCGIKGPLRLPPPPETPPAATTPAPPSPSGAAPDAQAPAPTPSDSPSKAK